MISIFYDLETTDLERVGQILNFAFVAVDQNFHIMESLTANVKISRLQLPRVGAVLTNRTNVLEHQAKATVTEFEAVDAIHDFIERVVAQAKDQPVALVGYNSASFDLDYLRTTFIRNGVNPYYQRVTNRDLLLGVRHLMAHSEPFREKLFAFAGEDKVRLRLESLCKIFGLLDGAQDHESLSDVLLTIKLAQTLKDQFGLDIRTFEPYQVAALHKTAKNQPVVLAEALTSNFSREKRVKTYPAILLDANARYALWIDLLKYREAKSKGAEIREAIKWRKFAEHLVVQHTEELPEDFSTEAQSAKEDFQSLRLSNFFTETDCDIEQFIFRISPQQIDELQEAFSSGEMLASGASPDMVQLYRRFTLENHPGPLSAELSAMLARYAEYRYGGKLKLTSSGKDAVKRHPTLSALLAEISKAEAVDSDVDRTIVTALRRFYLDSEIYQVAGDRLTRDRSPSTTTDSSPKTPP
jgi:hypothetical protein